jgi:hypothetical protein
MKRVAKKKGREREKYSKTEYRNSPSCWKHEKEPDVEVVIHQPP